MNPQFAARRSLYRSMSESSSTLSSSTRRLVPVPVRPRVAETFPNASQWNSLATNALGVRPL
jgi:hypothetical protein